MGKNLENLEEMLHVPFNMRQYVTTERYSIPGYPCLYLSGSVYGCWLELNKPPISNFYISRYEVNSSLKVLNLSLQPNDIQRKIEKCEKNCDIGSIEAKYIYTWPIICACSFIVNEKNRKFKSEYIIPQLLLQVITNSDNETIGVRGIKYFSVKSDYNGGIKPKPLYINYIFTTSGEKCSENRYSKNICDEFKLTYPVNMYMCNLLDESDIGQIACKKLNNEGSFIHINEDFERVDACIRIAKDTIIKYKNTDFFKVEKILCNMNHYNIN